MNFAVKLTGVDGTGGIAAIKALVLVSGGSLRWAKVDVFDKVRAGVPVTVPVDDPDDLKVLVEHGWSGVLDEEGVVEIVARVPAGKREDVAAVIRALGGSVR